ncbi:MAG TPA: hypothetical protein VNU71_01085, partial [Burkholderiaceae bacterium]|nr:hypothetical protein [Burkholderiaceae bacterium]
MDPLATTYPTTSKTSLDDWVCGVSSSLDEFVNTRPIAATLAAAAAGAGIVALLSLQSRSTSVSLPRRVSVPSLDAAPRAAKRVVAATNDGLSTLKTQIAELIAAIADRLPTQAQAARATETVVNRASSATQDAVDRATSATDAALEKAQATWKDVRARSEGLIKQAQPHV